MDSPFQFPRPKPLKICGSKITLFTRGNVAEPIWNFKFVLPNGKTEQRSTGTTDLEQAKRMAEDRYRKVEWRAAHNLSVTETTVAQAAASFAAKLQRDMARNGTTLNKQEMITKIERQIVPKLGNVDITLLNGKAIDDFLDAYEREWHLNKDVRLPHTVTKDGRGNKLAKPRVIMRKGRTRKPPSDLSRRNYQLLLRLICEHAVQQGMITAAEQPTFPITPKGKYRRGGFDEHEQTRLLAYLEQRVDECASPNHRHCRRLLWLYARFHILTGLRPGREGNSLRFQDVTPGGNAIPHWVVHVRRGKRGARKVLVAQALGEVIRLLREHHPDPQPAAWLWARRDGTVAGSFHASFVPVLEELGMRVDGEGRKRSLYSLRHAKISNDIQQGVNIVALAKNCGTSAQQINNHYDHVLHMQQVEALLGHTQEGR